MSGLDAFNGLVPLADLGRALAPTAALALLKVTVLLTLAIGLDRLTEGRLPARVRHRLLTLVVAAALVLPACAWVLPAWEVLPALPGATVPRADAGPTPQAQSAMRPAAPAATGNVSAEIPARPLERARPAAATPADPRVPSATTPSRRGDWFHAVWPALWLLGLAGMLAMLALTVRAERALLRRGEPVHGAWRRDLERLRSSVGVGRAVRLLSHRKATTPVTGGVLRPAVVVPRGTLAWPAKARRSVLAHELVHVLRFDALRHLLARVLAALYWFHPLARAVVRRAAMAREQACDEAVLDLGIRPSDYAGHLLTLAARAPAASPAMGLAMAHPSQLERRLLVILDPRRPLRGGLLASAALVLVIAAGGVLAAAQPAPWTAPTPPVPPTPVVAPSPPSVVVAPSPSPSPPSVVVAPSPSPPSVVVAPPSPSPVVAPSPSPTPPAPAVAASRSPAPPSAVVAPSPPAPAPASALPALPSPPAPAPSVVPAIAGMALAAPAASPDTACLEGRKGEYRGTMSYDGGLTSMVGSYNGDRVVMKHVTPALRVCARLHGDIGTPAGGNLVLARGAWAHLETIGPEGRQRVFVEASASGDPVYRLFVDGRACAWDARAQAWLTAVLDVVADVSEIGSIRGEVGSLRGAIGSIRGEVGSLRGQIGSIRGDIGSKRGSIGSLRGEIGSMRGMLGSLRGAVGSLRGQRFGADESERARIDDRIAELEAKIRHQEDTNRIRESELDAKIADLEAELDADTGRAQARIEDIEAQIVAVDADRRITALEADIEALDADARIAALERRLEPKVETLERAAASLSC